MSRSSKLLSILSQSQALTRTHQARPALTRLYSTQAERDVEVNIPMIRKMEKICRNYIDQLEQPGGKQYNIQNFMMMYIFGSTTNTEYRTKLFDHWPTYLEDFNECKSIMGYRYPETLVEEFLTLNIPKEAEILDMACGPGNVAFILKDHAYSNVDGLDPSKGLLEAAMQKGLYKQTFCCYVTPDVPTPIADNTYEFSSAAPACSPAP